MTVMKPERSDNEVCLYRTCRRVIEKESEICICYCEDHKEFCHHNDNQETTEAQVHSPIVCWWVFANRLATMKDWKSRSSQRRYQKLATSKQWCPGVIEELKRDKSIPIRPKEWSCEKKRLGYLETKRILHMFLRTTSRCVSNTQLLTIRNDGCWRSSAN